ncbi:hypothetical protein PPERSA_10579 [Pseudocohnilembus persalinus]|uniref:PIH1 domain-containing protein 1 n=1 Tax=Pseudocohnilembus persalinus TaxID=266149 RepID=A0A0V0Q983_PSEPJ|nr:hypothetical protein PPERSA_10579 [Pseudocohnilembus persalinus]|eukprot:KRW98808.1 hypothetical protein PPERSA_10579 [Pseudocohnilembus persalinus]
MEQVYQGMSQKKFRKLKEKRQKYKDKQKEKKKKQKEFLQQFQDEFEKKMQIIKKLNKNSNKQIQCPRADIEFFKVQAFKRINLQINNIWNKLGVTPLMTAFDRWRWDNISKQSLEVLKKKEEEIQQKNEENQENLNNKYSDGLSRETDGLKNMLMQSLLKQGIDQEYAEYSVEKILQATNEVMNVLDKKMQLVDTFQGNVVVQQNGENYEVYFSEDGSEEKLEYLCCITGGYYNKLKKNFTNFCEGVLNQDEIEFVFNDYLYQLLARYKSFQGNGGTQAAISDQFFEYLQEKFDCKFECFGSPLNSFGENKFCSAFYDVDVFFGSQGNFFEQKFKKGFFECNPPFIPEIMSDIVEFMEDKIKIANEKKKALGFCIIVPARQEEKFWNMLKSSEFCHSYKILKANKHQYKLGLQHENDGFRISNFDTGILFFVSQKGIGYGTNSPFPKGFQMKMPGQQDNGSFQQQQQQGGMPFSPEMYQQFMMQQGLMGQQGGMDPQQGMQGMSEKDLIKNMSDEQLMQLIQSNPELKAQLDKLQAQQGGVIGRSKPVSSKEYNESKNYEEFLDKEGGITIQPDNGTVYKSREESGEKFFINLVSHPAIEPPEEKFLVDFDNEAGVRIPMSFGTVREDHDNKGDICKVVDVIVNPNVIDAVKKDIQMNEFLKQMLANFVEQKYKIKISERMSQPNLKYKGKSVEFQRVKGKKAPKIQQLSEENRKAQEQIKKSENKLIQEIKEEQNLPEIIPRPQWELYNVFGQGQESLYDGDFDIEQIKYFKFVFEMPLLVTGKFINIEMKQDSFYIKVNKFYEIAMQFPCKVHLNKIKSYFNTKSRQLFVIVPPLKYEITEKMVSEKQQQEDTNNQQQEQNNVQGINDVQNKQSQIQLENDMLDDLV